jgi:hypothetical protein
LLWRSIASYRTTCNGRVAGVTDNEHFPGDAPAISITSSVYRAEDRCGAK